MSTRILCIGNALLPEDDAGPRVYGRLAGRALPSGVTLVDAGLAGLDLLAHFERADRVILVDTMEGFAEPGGVRVMAPGTVIGDSDPPVYGHGEGVAYLLKVLPRVIDGPLPEIRIVGLERPAAEETIGGAVAACLDLVAEGARDGRFDARA